MSWDDRFGNIWGCTFYKHGMFSPLYQLKMKTVLLVRSKSVVSLGMCHQILKMVRVKSALPMYHFSVCIQLLISVFFLLLFLSFFFPPFFLSFFLLFYSGFCLRNVSMVDLASHCESMCDTYPTPFSLFFFLRFNRDVHFGLNCKMLWARALGKVLLKYSVFFFFWLLYDNVCV